MGCKKSFDFCCCRLRSDRPWFHCRQSSCSTGISDNFFYYFWLAQACKPILTDLVDKPCNKTISCSGCIHHWDRKSRKLTFSFAETVADSLGSICHYHPFNRI